ncbi:thioredoxin family protein [Chitinophaga sp. sic0106]|uniref:thioredoxin family protein n=1 Tax=Chitinophaga sp. sic0106 TaxID=2854785 RepID=UPI001C46BD75|nr:thioredoxin family protein [Chitinophaga sp. sic0106]MBV7529753.1 thioredoxin family protein [Chitinophaga sp. sic0106]
MDFQAYEQEFHNILHNPAPAPPYDNPDYLNYTKLNWSRQSRWLKTGKLSEDIIAAVKSITQPQHWIIITEPWCGDASHLVPFFHLIAALNPLITTEYQLRDAPPFLIDQYLTNGTSKSIPKLVMRDAAGKDLAVWGPRPAGCQTLYDRLKHEKADFEQMKISLQQWYNEDKGVSVQLELLPLLHNY